MKKRLPLHVRILIGLGLGLVWGLISSLSGLNDFTVDWVKPFGTIFVNLLKLIAVPLVISSLIVGVTNLKDVSKLSRMGLKTILIYTSTTVIAITIGLVCVNIAKPGAYLSVEKREQLKERFATDATSKAEKANEVAKKGPLQPLVDIVPENIFKAFTENGSMLQAVFFAVFFGIGMVLLPGEKTASVRLFFDGVNEIVLKLVDIIMLMAPLGVFALISSLMAEFAGDNPADSIELLKALGAYGGTVIFALLLVVFLVYPTILIVLGKYPVDRFFKGIGPAQLLGFSTSSSNATLPVTMEQVEKELGVSEEVSSFVLPLGATINMDGTSLYQAVAAVFIAQAFGTELTLADQLTIVLTATLASIGSAGVPGAGMVMLVIVLESVGLDPAGLALIVAVDRILDMMRTVVNVTGDAMVSVVIGRMENQIDLPETE